MCSQGARVQFQRQLRGGGVAGAGLPRHLRDSGELGLDPRPPPPSEKIPVSSLPELTGSLLCSGEHLLSDGGGCDRSGGRLRGGGGGCGVPLAEVDEGARISRVFQWPIEEEDRSCFTAWLISRQGLWGDRSGEASPAAWDDVEEFSEMRRRASRPAPRRGGGAGAGGRRFSPEGGGAEDDWDLPMDF